MYDDVLRLRLPDGCSLIGFADDLALVVVAKEVGAVEAAANAAIQVIAVWMDEAGLDLAGHKTEAVLITSRKKVEYMSVQIGNTTIRSSESIKYLGVLLDNRLSFRPHVEYVTQKAAKMQGALSRMLPNIGGPKVGRRLLLARVVASVLLYAAPIWAKALHGNMSLRRKLAAPYRLSALRVISGFRTVSYDAALVLAGMIPVDILATEMRDIYEARAELGSGIPVEAIRRSERQASLATWQARWDATANGRWTHRLIPNVEEWLERSRGEVNFHLTQFLTGHGGYRKYLYRFKHEDRPECPNCPNSSEDPEHVLYHCPRYRALTVVVPSPENLIAFMLQTEENWRNASQLITGIQSDLRRCEKERRVRENA